MARTKKTAVETVAGIKGFNAQLKCRDFQFEVGGIYTHEGEVIACRGGLHAITAHPLAVFEYYAPAGSRFCRVELSGRQHSDDQVKTAAEILKVAAEIGITDLVTDAIKWVVERSHPEGVHATGYQGASSATGTRGAAIAIGVLNKVMGAEGNALFSMERADNGDVVSVACGMVGQDGIKPGVWYRAQGGELVEVGQ